MNYLKKYTGGSYRLFAVFFLLLSCILSAPAGAHVGSSGVIVQKQVGKYRLLISVLPPDVVPGTAKVTVYVEEGGITDIGARPIFFRSGDKGAPTHDVLTAVDKNRYEGDLWLMDSGSSSIELVLNGTDGQQTVIVPVMAVATALREMPEGTGLGLALLGVLLVVMMITIIGASNADGVLAPGQPVPATLGRRRWIGMGVGLVLMVLLLTGWRTWWSANTSNYRSERLYKPAQIQTSVKDGLLTISMDTTGFASGRQQRRLFSFLLPDHGKLMHTFMVRVPGLDAFAHLHPNRRDSLHYDTSLPSLPAGRYLLYSDVVYRSGFSETLTDTVMIAGPATHDRKPSDPDDSWLVTEPIGTKRQAVTVQQLDANMAACGKPGASMKLADNSTMYWTDKPEQVLEVGKLYSLKFAVADAQGKAAPLEPYLGMGGHAAVLRSDGSVYIHLHPVGTYSMAAEGSLVNRIADTSRTFHYPDANYFRDSIDRYVTLSKILPEAEKNKRLQAAMPGMSHAMPVNNMVEFPYAFPRAGNYRIFVQVKRNGQVLTGVFDTEVKEPLL